MVLTIFERRRPLSGSLNGFPLAQLGLLALVRLAEPIALTSILPYAYQMVLYFKVCHRDNAAFFAGILIASFSLAEACSGMFWGSVSDKYGRRPVLLLGCVGTLLSLLIVGFSTNFWMALVGRVLGGLLNGNIGVIQTMVGELVTKPEHEAPAYAVMPFVWSIGTILGPIIGGFFSEPKNSMPNIPDLAGVLTKFPYLLPNIVCAILLATSMIFGAFYLLETHPDMQPWSTPEELDNTTAETPLMATAGAVANAPANLRNEAYGTFDSVDIHEVVNWDVKASGRAYSISSSELTAVEPSTFSKRIVMLIVALGIFTYHSMSFDHLLPIYLEDKRDYPMETFSAAASGTVQNDFAGGLGFSVSRVGFIMSMNGIIALIVQAIFPLLSHMIGNWRLFVIVTIGHPIPFLLMTYLPLLRGPWLTVGIYWALIVRNLFNILAYPLLLIMIKQATPVASQLGKINGLAASTGAACRTLASPLAGLLYGVGSKMGYTPIAWWCTAIVALAGSFQLFFMTQQKGPEATIAPPAACRFLPDETNNSTGWDVVNVTVVEAGEYSDTDSDEQTPLIDV